MDTRMPETPGRFAAANGSLFRATFEEVVTTCPAPRGIDAITTLRHFAILTYAVPVERVRGLIPDRFDLESIDYRGRRCALLSVVPFEDQDFRAAAFSSPRWRFGQTNYRIYIRDRATGSRAVWFLGTVLGSHWVQLPRHAWKLPWHHGRFTIDCVQDASGRYTRYRVVTDSDWAPAVIDLEHDPTAPMTSDGFADTETALVVLTHPLVGYFTRRDGRLGTYAVWHDRLTPTAARVREARITLLDRTGIVSFVEQADPYSVLIQPETEFLIRLPPRLVGVRA